MEKVIKGTQTNGAFVPKQSTDFIFCNRRAVWFFWLQLNYSFIPFIILLHSKNWQKKKSTFSRIYGYGVASILFIHFFINISMSVGMFPVVGIPLPFISYGGSSLISMTILLFF